MSYLTFFHTKSLKSGVYFMLTTHFSLNMKFLLEMLDLYLELLKFTIAKVHSHIKVFPNILMFSSNENKYQL